MCFLRNWWLCVVKGNLNTHTGGCAMCNGRMANARPGQKLGSGIVLRNDGGCVSFHTRNSGIFLSILDDVNNDS